MRHTYARAEFAAPRSRSFHLLKRCATTSRRNDEPAGDDFRNVSPPATITHRSLRRSPLAMEAEQSGKRGAFTPLSSLHSRVSREAPRTSSYRPATTLLFTDAVPLVRFLPCVAQRVDREQHRYSES